MINNGRAYSEGLIEWAMDVASSDEDIAGKLLDRFEEEVNRLLPDGEYIDMATCEPVFDPDAWESLVQKTANRVALGKD